MGSEKRRRQKANKEAKLERAQPIPELTDLDFDRLLEAVSVRDDCERASTRRTPDGLVLTRCAAGADVAGGCPADCVAYERRRIGGLGTGT